VVLCDFLITAKRTNNERRENLLSDHADALLAGERMKRRGGKVKM
jgi:hypothetical protein